MMIVEVSSKIRRLGYRARGRALLRAGINVFEGGLTTNESRLITQLVKSKLVTELKPDESEEDHAKILAAKEVYLHRVGSYSTPSGEEYLAPAPKRMRRRVRRQANLHRMTKPEALEHAKGLKAEKKERDARATRAHEEKKREERKRSALVETKPKPPETKPPPKAEPAKVTPKGDSGELILMGDGGEPQGFGPIEQKELALANIDSLTDDDVEDDEDDTE